MTSRRGIKALAIVLLTSTGCGAMIGATPAAAQASTAAAQDSTAAAQGTSANGQVDDIIVTAQHRAERLQKVPVAVTAISSQDLQNRGFNDPSQLQYLAPSLVSNGVSSAPGVNTYIIRGVGTASFSNQVEYSVSTVIDDVFLGRPEMGTGQFSDFERVEVLRGPQGTLFGKNASSGVINYITKRPVLGQTSESAHVEVADINTPGSQFTGKADATVNLPITSNVALRINGFGTYQPPLVKNLNPQPQTDFGMREGGVKAKLLWEPTDRLSVYFLGDASWERGIGSGAFTLRVLPTTSVLTAPNKALGIVPAPGNLYNAPDGPSYGQFRVGGVESNIGYDLGGGWAATNILAYRYYETTSSADLDLSNINYANNTQLALNDKQYTEEFRITSPTRGLIDGQAGVFLYKGDYDRNMIVSQAQGLANLPAGFGYRGAQSISEQDAKSAAAFGQATLHATDRLRFTAGARETYDYIRLDYAVSKGPNVVIQSGSPGELVQQRNNWALSYRFAAEYDLARNVLLYGSYARGYKGPSFNATADPTLANPVNPEIPLAWEAGFKSSLFDHLLTLNVAGFTTTFKGYQATTLALDTTTGVFTSVLQNAGSLRTRGVEVEFRAKPTRSLTVSGGFTYADAIYTDFQGVPCYPGQTVALGCATIKPARAASPGVPAAAAVTAVNASGNPLNAPKFTGTITVRYERPISANLRGFVQGSGYTRSGVLNSPNGDPNSFLAGYQIYDASIGVTSADNRWSVSVFGRNLGDHRVINTLQNNSASPGAYQQGYNLNSFRTVGVTLDVHI